jgi:hypothetical protein
VDIHDPFVRVNIKGGCRRGWIQKRLSAQMAEFLSHHNDNFHLDYDYVSDRGDGSLFCGTDSLARLPDYSFRNFDLPAGSHRLLPSGPEIQSPSIGAL